MKEIPTADTPRGAKEILALLKKEVECDRLGKRIRICDFECHHRKPHVHAVVMDVYDYSRCQHKDSRRLVVAFDNIEKIVKAQCVSRAQIQKLETYVISLREAELEQPLENKSLAENVLEYVLERLGAVLQK